ncbi:MAG: ABC transporter substrate-binding protein [Firmicutes bacterium]|nr:ABC transporter substrate-binding protein [Bacillota bacterium]
MKRYWRLMIIVLLIVLTGAAAVGAQSRTVQIAYNPMPFNLPSMVERQHGFLSAQGWSVEYNTFLVGSAMTEAMASGNLSIAPVMGGTSAIVSKAGGRDIRIIGAYSQAPRAFALAALPGGTRLDQLRGKKIAVPLGTEAHFLLTKILAEQGLSLRDVQVVNLLIPDGITALQSNQVDAAMVVEPVMSRLLQGGRIEVLRDGEGLIGGMTFTVVPATLVDSPEVAAFQGAHAESLAFINENFDEVLELAAAEMNLPLPVVQRIAEKYSFESDITEEVRLCLEETIDFLYNEGIIRRPVSVDELVVGE